MVHKFYRNFQILNFQLLRMCLWSAQKYKGISFEVQIPNHLNFQLFFIHITSKLHSRGIWKKISNFDEFCIQILPRLKKAFSNRFLIFSNTIRVYAHIPLQYRAWHNTSLCVSSFLTKISLKSRKFFCRY